ncbi:MAG: hypothetical protein KBT11_06550 [Treponema sp.]|nr:hypothetical protein [Candidatus Treponema equifaecale]
MKKLFFVFLAVLLCFVSCSKKGPEIELKPMELAELSPRIQWALVTNPYVACFAEASYESNTVASFRKGEIYQVEGNCTVKVGEGKDEKKETWYALHAGWVPGSAVKIFSNKLRAEEALKSLK